MRSDCSRGETKSFLNRSTISYTVRRFARYQGFGPAPASTGHVVDTASGQGGG